MTEGQMFKPRTRFMAAALSAALVVGMAPSFALIAPHEAYAAESGLVAVQLDGQDEAQTATNADSGVNWVNLYGGTGNSNSDTFSQNLVNSFENAIVLDDGTIVAAGVKNIMDGNSKNNIDASLLFYDADGEQSKSINFSSSQYDGFEKVIQASDGSLIAVGCVGNGDGDFANWMEKTNNTSNGDYDALICKIDRNGTLLKAVAFGGTKKDMFRDVIELDNGDFIAVGYESSQDGDLEGKSKTSTRDAFVVKFSADLSNPSIVDILEGSSSMMEEARVAIKGVDGGFAIAGYAYSVDGDFEDLSKSAKNKSDWFFASYDSQLKRTNLRMYGGTDNDYLMGVDYDYIDENGVVQESPTGYVLVGYGKSTDGDFEGKGIGDGKNDAAALLRVAADGTLREVVPIATAESLQAEDVISSPAGYLVAGRFTNTLTAGDNDPIASKGNEDVYTAFISKGDSGYVYGPVKTFGGTGLDRVRSVTIDSNANVLLTGTTQSDEFEGAAVDDTTRAFIMSVAAESVTPETAYTTQKAAGVATRIDKLPSADSLTLDDADAVAAARAAYDALTSEQQEQVTNSATLVSAEKKLGELKKPDLKTQIEEAKVVTFGHTSLDLWVSLQTALTNANVIVDDKAATLQQVTSSIDAISEAMQAVNDSNVTGVELPAENGDYTLTATIYKESSFRTASPATFPLNRQFDPNMRLVKTNDGLKLQLLYTSSVDMQKVSLDGIEAAKSGFGPQGADGSYGLYLFEIALPSDFSLNADHKLSFSYDTGNPTLGDNGVMTHSVYLVNLGTGAWPGFETVATELGSAKTAYKAGSYAVPATFKHESEDKASMAAGAFNSTAILTVAQDGSTTVEIGTKPSVASDITAYADNVKVFQGDGATGEAVDAEEVTTQVVTVNGVEVTVPTTLKFTVPAAVMASDDIYVSLEAPGSPMSSAQNARLQLGYALLSNASDAAVERVTSLISWLSSDAGLAEQVTVETASAAYEALTDGQKKAVPAESVTLLNAAKASVEAAVADKAAADKVSAAIAALPAKSKLKISDKAAVKAARSAYTKLTSSQKAMVTNLSTLKAAEDQIATLETNALTVASVTLTKATSFTYTGSALKPAVTVKAKDGSTIAASNYDVKYSDNKNVGTATVTVTGKGTFIGSATATFKITQAESAIKVAKTSVSKTYGDTAFSLGASMSKGDNKLAYKSSNTKVATVDAKGKVTIQGVGTAKITVSAAKTTNYKAATSKTVTVTVAKKANTLKVSAVKATQTAKYGKAATIAASKAFKVSSNASKGKVSYKLASVPAKAKGKITVASDGKVTVKKGLARGTYTVKVNATSAATANYKSATVKNVTFKVKVS